ncbi:MAG: hypothetical protein ACOCQR_00065 [bacterium]
MNFFKGMLFFLFICTLSLGIVATEIRIPLKPALQFKILRVINSFTEDEIVVTFLGNSSGVSIDKLQNNNYFKNSESEKLEFDYKQKIISPNELKELFGYLKINEDSWSFQKQHIREQTVYFLLNLNNDSGIYQIIFSENK